MLSKEKAFHNHFRKHHNHKFDPSTFNWREGSNMLAATYGKHFEVWWKYGLFCGNYTILMRHCIEHFKDWWPYAAGITQYELIVFCGEHLPIWWDADSFQWNKKNMMYLETHCTKHQNIWLPDAIIHKLTHEGDSFIL